MTRAYVALGSNLGGPVQQVKAAMLALDAVSRTHRVRSSSLYRTRPVGFLDQPDFINAVVELETDLTPLALLDALLALESDFGRVRTFQNAPRILDLDLLWVQEVCLTEGRLILPHPRMAERAFVIVPLCEIAPQLRLGEQGSVQELAAGMDRALVERLSD